jgi:hypothetical protein
LAIKIILIVILILVLELKRGGRGRLGWRRFQFLCKIITAIFAALGLDDAMTSRGGHLNPVPACNPRRFGGLIVKENQLGAGL